jgi:hypothetical protein
MHAIYFFIDLNKAIMTFILFCLTYSLYKGIIIWACYSYRWRLQNWFTITDMSINSKFILHTVNFDLMWSLSPKNIICFLSIWWSGHQQRRVLCYESSSVGIYWHLLNSDELVQHRDLPTVIYCRQTTCERTLNML